LYGTTCCKNPLIVLATYLTGRRRDGRFVNPTFNHQEVRSKWSVDCQEWKDANANCQNGTKGNAEQREPAAQGQPPTRPQLHQATQCALS
jgi:hypothetical protein